MVFCLFMGTLPAVALVWVAITCILFMTFMRVFFWQHVNNLVADWDLSMLQGPEAARGQRVAAGGGGGLLMALGSGGGGGGGGGKGGGDIGGGGASQSNWRPQRKRPVYHS
mmetsp:Transcript_4075/g.9760  ORF Transcript_4075/g.9760 Transcript_4075/m.9760 type:complete len:111 (+) Transcript_4075:241-573(+)